MVDPREDPGGVRSHVLSDEQRRAVEWVEGPLIVLAGAGTGKTTVIVERAAWLLGQGEHPCPLPHAEPENILVLTYNVRAAAELAERFERRLGPAIAGRMRIQNFHAFCHRILRDHAAEAGLPDPVEVLDAVGQRLVLDEVLRDLDLLYHPATDLRSQLGHFADIVNRARDELVTPAEYLACAGRRRAAFEEAHGPGSYAATIAALRERGDLRAVREVRRAMVRGGADDARRAADREARRAAGGSGAAVAERLLPPDRRAVADGLRPSYLRDAEALEVLRIEEEARAYGAYVDELARHRSLDFAEQIVRAIGLLRERPNILRRYQRQFHHVLVDEFQDANVAQVMLLEMLGRGPDRPDNVVVVGDDDQSIYRFRGASHAAFEQFRDRFGGPPPWDPGRPGDVVAQTALLLNRRSDGNILAASDRLVRHNPDRLKSGPLRTTRPAGAAVEVIVASDEQDEAEAIVGVVRQALAALPPAADPAEPADPTASDRAPRWSDVAVLYRRHRHREAIAARLRDEGIPYVVSGGSGLFEHPDVRDVEAALRTIANPADSVSATRLLGAAPWRLDATEILRLTRAAQFGGNGTPGPIPVLQAAADALEQGSLPVDAAAPPGSVTAADGAWAVGGVRGTSSADTAVALQLSLLPPEELAGGNNGSRTGGRAQPRPPRFLPAPLPATTRTRLRQAVDCVTDLAGNAHRHGPLWVLDAYLVRTNLLRDLVAAGAADAQLAVLALARFMRFVAAWEREHPRGSLVDFLAYLDLYQELGGDPDAEAGMDDMDGVRLMTVHQAKGLEWEIVVVPRLVEGQFPDDRAEEPVIPVELLRQQPPAGFGEAEERRLCYVAMTRARRRLVMTTIESPGGRYRPGRFVGEIAPLAWKAAGASPPAAGVLPPPAAVSPPAAGVSPPAVAAIPEPLPVEPDEEPGEEPIETPAWPEEEPAPPIGPGFVPRPVPDWEPAVEPDTEPGTEPGTGPGVESGALADAMPGAWTSVPPDGDVILTVRRAGPETLEAPPVPPGRPTMPSQAERRFARRRRAVEIIGLLERLDGEDLAEREALLAELVDVARDAHPANGVERADGDRITLRAVAAGSDAGARLLRMVPVQDRFSHTAFGTYLACPLQYAFQRVYQVPVPEEDRRGYFTFGSVVHEAFEAFGRAAHEARAAGLEPPGLADLQRSFDRSWQPLAFPDQPTAAAYRSRAPLVLRNFYERHLSRLGESVCFEQGFRLPLDPGDGGPRAYIVGAIDRIDRLPDGSLELIDYKTGRARTQAQVDADEQLSTYALAMREGAVIDPANGRPLAAPSRLTLYFVETDGWISTTRSDAQLDEHRARLIELVARIRSGDFAATPGARTCDRCDYRRLCPARWGSAQA